MSYIPSKSVPRGPGTEQEHIDSMKRSLAISLLALSCLATVAEAEPRRSRGDIRFEQQVKIICES